MSIESALINQKCKEYKEYIDNHVLNVQKAWIDMKNNQEAIEIIENFIPNTNIDTIINLVDLLVQNHDSSKYSREEFDAYRKYFYPISPEEKEKCKDEFDAAWKHHYMNNMHHWDYWYYSGNMDSMPMHFVIEMICDWKAMEYAGYDSTVKWYEDNKNDIHLGDRQREFTENLIRILDK